MDIYDDHLPVGLEPVGLEPPISVPIDPATLSVFFCSFVAGKFDMLGGG